MMRTIMTALALLVLASSTSISQGRRPTRDEINLLCTNISDHSKDADTSSDFVDLYERTLWKISGALVGMDTPAVAAAKVRAMWNEYHDVFKCDTEGLRHGNVLKYAIHSNNFGFVLTLASHYGGTLNFADPADGKTVLDWVRDGVAERERRGYRAAALELKSIQTILRDELHARYASELSGPVHDHR